MSLRHGTSRTQETNPKGTQSDHESSNNQRPVWSNLVLNPRHEAVDVLWRRKRDGLPALRTVRPQVLEAGHRHGGGAGRGEGGLKEGRRPTGG